MPIAEATQSDRIVLLFSSTVLSPPAAIYQPSEAASTDTIDIFKELTSLLTLENYNGLTIQASPYAYENARGYLESASSLMRIPRPEFTPDGEGGIDIEWENQGRFLAINFSSAGGGDFISWREPDGRYEGEPITEERLIEKLDWLTS